MMKQILVLKIGTSTLTLGSNLISRGKMEDIALQLQELQEQYNIILVSSGAVAAAKQTIKWNGGNTDDIAQKQALAAIGQPFLMNRYQDVFADYNLKIAQCLLTYYDVSNSEAQQNILNTITILWQNQYIPIINENDTVATEEIKFGDNDKLAALVAILVKANLLVLASDIDGLYNKDPKVNSDALLIKEINNISDIEKYIGKTQSLQGTGGMHSKIIAADICMKNNIEMWIVNGQKSNFLMNAMENEGSFSKFINFNN